MQGPISIIRAPSNTLYRSTGPSQSLFSTSPKLVAFTEIRNPLVAIANRSFINYLRHQAGLPHVVALSSSSQTPEKSTLSEIRPIIQSNNFSPNNLSHRSGSPSITRPNHLTASYQANQGTHTPTSINISTSLPLSTTICEGPKHSLNHLNVWTLC